MKIAIYGYARRQTLAVQIRGIKVLQRAIVVKNEKICFAFHKALAGLNEGSFRCNPSVVLKTIVTAVNSFVQEKLHE